jgi:hypothetical protein
MGISVTQILTVLLSQLETQENITDEDVLTLRQTIFGDNAVSITEADALFKLNSASITRSAAWPDMFMEAITDFLVRQTLPYGYVDEANAAWLIVRISHDGTVETMTELRTLINILKTARNSPDRLVRFALEQVKIAVMTGEGVMGRGRRLQPGIIGEAEVSLLRAVLYACGGDDNIAISRAEAEVVFELNAASNVEQNHESWTVLFRQVIANHLMFMTTPPSPSRDEALRREAFLQERGDIRRGFAKLDTRSVFSAFKDTLFNNAFADAPSSSPDVKVVSSSEAQWLSARIGADGIFDKNEQALLSWIGEENSALYEMLRPLIGADKLLAS